jgi:hypothetical protein
MNTLTTEQKGQIALAKALIEAAKKGVQTLLPTSPARYDLVLDCGDRFYRTQVKYADGKSPHSRGVVQLTLRRRNRCYKWEEIDILLVYLPQRDYVCWLGADEFHDRTHHYLRYQPAKNGHRAKCLLLDDFIW